MMSAIHPIYTSLKAELNKDISSWEETWVELDDDLQSSFLPGLDDTIITKMPFVSLLWGIWYNC